MLKQRTQAAKIGGFTVVELMVALSVLSTILVMATVIMIQIGGLYSKGVNAASLQNASRTILGDISSTIEFSGQPPGSPTCTTKNCYYGTPITKTTPTGESEQIYAYCVNTTRYSYVLNRESGNDTNPAGGGGTRNVPHVLWRDTMSNTGSCRPLNIFQNPVPQTNSVRGSGFDLVPAHMRLTHFIVNQTPAGSGIYAVEVWMAYGDTDLLTTPDATGATNCLGGAGSQFCATSQLNDKVTRRVGN